MTKTKPAKPVTISVIIVSYNVKDFLEQALQSIFRALQGIPSEIFVVDNNSIDGSAQMVAKRFPDVKVVVSNKNLGFSGGNNLAIKKANGEYIVLINPDTVVQEDTFSRLLQFFKDTPDASAVTCKILNPDGSFSVDCRHSIPTPGIALWKILGFSRLFPKSKLFGRYNLTYLDENETYTVEAISGSFMMLKKSIVEKVGLLDETFFMYCEDIDYCYRVNQAGGKIYYFPKTQIVHYKGESSKAHNLDYVIMFNKSLYQFYKKHYQQKYIYPFKWLILLGVILRGMVIYIKNFLKKYYPLFWDLIILNVIIFVSFWVRLELKGSFFLQDFFNQHIIINILTSIAFILSSLFFEIVKKERFSPERIFKVVISTFIFISALTFFFKQFGFSRLVVINAAFFSTIFLIGWRVFFSKYALKYSTALSKEFLRKKTLVVGDDKETQELLNKLHQRLETGVSIQGLVSVNRENIGNIISGFPVVASLDQLDEYVRLKKIDLIIFSTNQISYEAILKAMNTLQNHQVEFKLVPGHLEFMIGKSNIERLDSLPLVDIDYAYGSLFNRLSKRIFDFSLSLLLVVLTLPFLLISKMFLFKNIEKREIYYGGQKYVFSWYSKNRLLRYSLHFFDVLTGKISFVGAPLYHEEKHNNLFNYKPGLTGLVQLNRNKIIDNKHYENIELHYLKNQNLFLDLDILFRHIFKRSEKTY